MSNSTQLWEADLVTQLRAFKVNCAVLDFGVCTDTDLEDALCCAQDLVASYTGKRWGTYIDTKTFDGNGKCKLFFQGVTRDKLVSYTQIDIGCCTDSNATACTDDAQDAIGDLNQGNHLDICCVKCCGCSCGNAFGSSWPVGCGNIKVTGTWGEAMPALLKKALFTLAAGLLNPSLVGGGSCGGSVDTSIVKRIKYPKYEVEFHQRSSDDFTTGFSDVDSMLKHFIQDDIVQMFAIPSNPVNYNLCGGCGCEFGHGALGGGCNSCNSSSCCGCC